MIFRPSAFPRPFLLLFLPFLLVSPAIAAVGLAPQPADSSARMTQRQLKKYAGRRLDQIRKDMRKMKDTDPLARMAQSSEAAFEVLAVFSACFDRNGEYFEDIKDEERQYAQGAAAKEITDAHRIKNAVIGIYGLNTILFKIRFQNDTAKMRDLLQQHDFTVQGISREQSLFPTLRIMSNSMFNYLYVVVASLDTSRLFANDLANFEFQFTQGERVARSDEDRFLNAMYRMFELNRLWGISIAKKSISEFGKISRDQKKRIDALSDARMQTAVAMEYYYHVLDLLTRKFLQYKM